MGDATDTTAKTLSMDAKATLGAVFQNGMTLSYQLIQSRPSARLQAALDELVAAHFLVVDRGCVRADGSRSISYKARVPTEAYKRFAKKGVGIVMAEPIPQASGGPTP